MPSYKFLNTCGCLVYTSIIFAYGLWPLNFRSFNGVTWLKTKNGIDFQDIGIIYGTAESKGFDYKSLTHPQSHHEFFDNLTGEITSFEIRDEVVLALERKGVRFVRFDNLEALD